MYYTYKSTKNPKFELLKDILKIYNFSTKNISYINILYCTYK